MPENLEKSHLLTVIRIIESTSRSQSLYHLRPTCHSKLPPIVNFNQSCCDYEAAKSTKSIKGGLIGPETDMELKHDTLLLLNACCYRRKRMMVHCLLPWTALHCQSPVRI